MIGCLVYYDAWCNGDWWLVSMIGVPFVDYKLCYVAHVLCWSSPITLSLVMVLSPLFFYIYSIFVFFILVKPMHLKWGLPCPQFDTRLQPLCWALTWNLVYSFDPTFPAPTPLMEWVNKCHHFLMAKQSSTLIHTFFQNFSVIWVVVLNQIKTFNHGQSANQPRGTITSSKIPIWFGKECHNL